MVKLSSLISLWKIEACKVLCSFKVLDVRRYPQRMLFKGSHVITYQFFMMICLYEIVLLKFICKIAFSKVKKEQKTNSRMVRWSRKSRTNSNLHYRNENKRNCYNMFDSHLHIRYEVLLLFFFIINFKRGVSFQA